MFISFLVVYEFVLGYVVLVFACLFYVVACFSFVLGELGFGVYVCFCELCGVSCVVCCVVIFILLILFLC